MASAGWRPVLGIFLGLIARLWLATLRVTVVADEGLQALADRPWVFAFFHGTQWPLLAWRRRRPSVVLVSWSLDGAIQARTLTMLGFRVIRGSTSRGGVRGLVAVARALRVGGVDAAFAVDGPRGPYGVAQLGARVAARAADGVLVPLGAAVASGTVFARAWDRFSIAWPFARVVVCLGAAIEPGATVTERDEALARGIFGANARARTVLGGRADYSGVIPDGSHEGAVDSSHAGGFVARSK